MNQDYYNLSVKEGDAVLIGNDKIEIRAFSSVLRLSEYFRSHASFGGPSSRFEFSQFSSADLSLFLHYLHGVNAGVTDKLIEMLDYFQVPLTWLKNSGGKIPLSDLSLENITRIYGVHPFTPADLTHIGQRMLKENKCTDDNLWMILMSDPRWRKSNHLYIKISCVRKLLNQDFRALNFELSDKSNGEQINYCLSLMEEYEYIPASYLGDYTVYLVKECRGDDSEADEEDSEADEEDSEADEEDSEADEEDSEDEEEGEEENEDEENEI